MATRAGWAARALACALAAGSVPATVSAAPRRAAPFVAGLFSTGERGCAPSVPTARPLISFFFVEPRSTPEANVDLLETVCTDAITFGARVVPAPRAALPPEVAALVPPGASVYRYRGGARLDRRALAAGDEQVVVRGVTWSVVRTTPSTVVVASDATGDPQGALAAAGDRLGRRTLLGMPRPRQDPARPYLPDTGYADVVAAFTERFVRDAVLDGADGFYQTAEMPVGGSPRVWGTTLDLYRAQNAAVSRSRPRATVVVAPYVESRLGKGAVTPGRARSGAAEIMATASGVDLVLAPQDGLGTGATALRADRSRDHLAPTEDYLAAMRAGAGGRLSVTVEVMRPALGGRVPTTRSRVAQQVAAEGPYADCLLAFTWEDTRRGIGAARVPGGITGLATSAR